jgi:hypothetical protein
MKECSNCKIEMELIEFNKKKETKDGFSSKCKICEKERAILWFNNNINIIKETKKKYYLNNKENLKEKNKK